jgi:hypothetical protein
MGQALKEADIDKRDWHMSSGDVRATLEVLGFFAALAENYKFELVQHAANDLRQTVERIPLSSPDAPVTIDRAWRHQLMPRIDHLLRTVEGTLITRKLFALTPEGQALYEPRRPLFGESFSLKFGSAKYDLEEAAKCLATDRGTAAVFHLMRIMEVGLRSVYRCLGIPEPLEGAKRNWNHILSRIREERLSRGNQWKEKDLFQSLYALLDAVKDAWRNNAMHMDEKYTPDDAERIYTTVRGFMSKVADRMDELGQPLA